VRSCAYSVRYDPPPGPGEAAIPSTRAVGSYPGRLSSVIPASLTYGRASTTALKLASAAVQTAGDAVARYESVGASPDTGLYGGSATASASGDQLTPTNDELVPGVRVSGAVTIGATTVTAALRVAARFASGRSPSGHSKSLPGISTDLQLRAVGSGRR
jgi:hypothetical protein